MQGIPNIRLASAADLDALVQLAGAFRDHLGQSSPAQEDFRRSFSMLLESDETEFLLACDGQQAALGYVQCRYRYSAWVSALTAEIEDLFVIREARRYGVGLLLLEVAIARAAARGCRVIGLNTNERNEAAVALYRRLGFHAERARWQEGRQLWFEKVIEVTGTACSTS
jgi:ribosomal protein S18 acetylase RimI-like enzyme